MNHVLTRPKLTETAFIRYALPRRDLDLSAYEHDVDSHESDRHDVDDHSEHESASSESDSTHSERSSSSDCIGRHSDSFTSINGQQGLNAKAAP